jgi:hypothetical protein
MSDWLDDLTAGIEKAEEAQEKREENRKYILHRADVLKTQGPRLWEDLLESLGKSISELNLRIGVKFPGDKSKEVVLERTSPTAVRLHGNAPDVLIICTYQPDNHTISISATRRTESASEGRQGLLLMELNSEGHPCLANVDRHPIAIESASRYCLECGLATYQPPSPR